MSTLLLRGTVRLKKIFNAMNWGRLPPSLLIIIVHVVVCSFLAIDYARSFLLKDDFLWWQLFVVIGMGLPVFALGMWSSSKFVRFLGWYLCGLLLAIFPLVIIIQKQATLFIAQRVSLLFIYDNWPAIHPFISDWILGVLLLGVVLLSMLLALSLKDLSIRVNRRYVTCLMVGAWITALSAAVVTDHNGINRLHWEPMLGFFGYKGGILDPERTKELNDKEKQANKLYVPSKRRPKKNVILFMADSINPNNLSSFKYFRETTPFLDSLSQRYPHVAKAIGRSTCADSICGVMSTLTSRHFRDVPSGDILSLGRVLKQHGYTIHMVLVGDHRRFLYGQYGRFIEQESDTIFDYTISKHSINSDHIALEGLSALPQFGDSPSLIFVFFFSSHLSGEVEPKYGIFGPYLKNKVRLLRKKDKFTKEDISAISDNYDNKLIQLNHFISSSWKILEAKGYTQDSFFLFLADHGEELGYRDRIGHGLLTEGSLKIPFVFGSTGNLPDLTNRVPHQLDVAPTILDSLGLPKPSNWQGQSLYNKKRNALSFHEFGIHRLKKGKNCFAVFGALIKFKKAKYIYCKGALGAIENQLFNLSSDPYEKRNLWPHTGVEERLALKKIIGTHFEIDDWSSVLAPLN